MIGARYWTTGIRVTWNRSAHNGSDGVRLPGWGASLDFYDDGFADDNTDTRRIATEGTLHTRYSVVDGDTTDGLTVAVDTLLTDAARLGIHFRADGPGPALYVQGDGDDPAVDLPGDWRVLVAAQCARIGWRNAYEGLTETEEPMPSPTEAAVAVADSFADDGRDADVAMAGTEGGA